MDFLNYQFTGEDIQVRPWEKEQKTITIKAMRELQQKRIMENAITKKLKKKCFISNKNYKCPLCNTDGHNHLEAAHIGERGINIIQNIIEEYGINYPIWFLHEKLIEKENHSILQISCTKCNKLCE